MKIDQLKKLQEYAEFSPYTGTMKKPDIHWEGENPLCGDALTIDLKVIHGKIADARFEHRGCALSGAATSILLDHIIGKRITTLSDITPEKHLDLLGIPVSPGRLNCALLPLRGITSGQKKQKQR